MRTFRNVFWKGMVVHICIAMWVGIPEGRADAGWEGVERYNIIWTSPSTNSSGSMPIGNGDIGLNVWVEQNGDLLFYIGKTDAWCENAALLKLGRVRIQITPNPFRSGTPFAQTLRLKHGAVEIKGGEEASKVAVNLWVDANEPVVRIEVHSRVELSARVSLEIWRTEEREIRGQETTTIGQPADGPQRWIIYPDVILPPENNRIVWLHRNRKSAWPENLKMQGLGQLVAEWRDPLLHRTFGGAIQGDGLITEAKNTLKSAKPQKDFTISVFPLTAQTETVEAWVEKLTEGISRIEARDKATAWKSHFNWWKDFWNRSWIRIGGNKDADKVTAGYILQRFMSACAGRGRSPIKFNGGIFTVDARERNKIYDRDYDADYRMWGGAYWFQNTRLLYWPMVAAGDFDLMKPLFLMYRDALPLARERTKRFFGHEGAFFPETLLFWGGYTMFDYGWDRTNKPLSEVANSFIRYYWQGGLELTAMMLDYYDYTQDEQFARDTLVPFAIGITMFYDLHYPRDEKGKILLKPAAALETWHEAVNPLPEIAGLQWLLERLPSLSAELISGEQRQVWRRMRQELPPLPTRREDGKAILVAADKLIGPTRNAENPDLYAIFPYRIYGMGRPDLEIGQITFQKRRVKQTGCWMQDSIQAAYLGFADAARDYTVENFSTHHNGSRFPAFWGPSADWIPDLDHGGVAMMALQAMLLQAVKNDILLFPAWPKEWDVEFKLRAPFGTTVEGVYRQGKLLDLKVTPEERLKDVVRMQPQLTE